jgi:L,D-transpeptidase ErfK/SrfK
MKRAGLIRLLSFYAIIFLVSTPALGDPFREMSGHNADHTATKNEDLIVIAKRFNLAIDHIAFANGLAQESVKVAEGSVLTIPGTRILPGNPPRTGLVLNVPERGMYWYKNGTFQRFIPVSVGKPPDAKTPIGQFHIIEKVPNPTWYPPSWAESTKPVPPGPDNPLGNRWIGISATRVGIHGTNDPLNVGASVTHGCIRCYPEHVEKLFTEVSVGLPVRIEYETAKLGKDSQGQPYIVTFPDPYEKSDPLKAAQKLLTQNGYGSLLDDKKFMAKLKLNLGTPISLRSKLEEPLSETDD